MELSPCDQRFEFSLLIDGTEVFKVPGEDQGNLRRTIGCRLIDDDEFENIADTVYRNNKDGRKYLLPTVVRMDMNLLKEEDVYIQHLYLDDSEPSQRMRQDLVGRYISFQV